jgi:hypothetical protein
VLNTLTQAKGGWVSGNTLVAAGAGYRFGARILELRKKGYPIEARPSKDSKVFDYRLP